jgi:hypothetical protein
MTKILQDVWPDAQALRDRGPLLVPTLLVGVVTVLSVGAMMPLMRSAYAGKPELLPTVTYGVWAVTLLSPLTTLVKAAVLGGVAWAVLVLTSVEARYRSLVSMVVYAQIILALQGAWIVALLWLRGRSHLLAPGDLMVSTGPDAFVRDPTSPLAALARGVGPFHVAWVVLLALGFAAISRRSWKRTSVAAIAVWMMAVGMTVVRAAF